MTVRHKYDEDIKKCLEYVLSKCQMGDWFVLYQLSKNCNPYFFREVIKEFAIELKLRPKRSRGLGTLSRSIPEKGERLLNMFTKAEFDNTRPADNQGHLLARKLSQSELSSVGSDSPEGGSLLQEGRSGRSGGKRGGGRAGSRGRGDKRSSAGEPGYLNMD